VCELGARLVREHAAADARLRAYARTHGVDPDRIAHPYDAANHGSLKHPELPFLVGREFDWQLAAAVVAEQQADIDRARAAAALTNDLALKVLIERELPMLEANQAAAEALAPTATIPPPPPQGPPVPTMRPVPQP
jgi:predicted outer membrane protein